MITGEDFVNDKKYPVRNTDIIIPDKKQFFSRKKSFC